MNHHIITFIVAIIGSYIGTVLHPALMMLFPIVAIYMGLTTQDPSKWFSIITIGALLLDVFSGLIFGLYTLSLLIVYVMTYVSRQFLLQSDQLLIILPTGAIFLALYAVILSPWTGFAPFATYWFELLLTYVLVIILLHYAFFKISRRTI